jgi:hypothetical protein
VSKVRIEMTSPINGRVFVDDCEIHDVYAVSFNASVDHPATVTIDLRPTRLEIQSGVTDVVQIGEAVAP